VSVEAVSSKSACKAPVAHSRVMAGGLYRHSLLKPTGFRDVPPSRDYLFSSARAPSSPSTNPGSRLALDVLVPKRGPQGTERMTLNETVTERLAAHDQAAFG
jgi:hypothetical protein